MGYPWDGIRQSFRRFFGTGYLSHFFDTFACLSKFCPQSPSFQDWRTRMLDIFFSLFLVFAGNVLPERTRHKTRPLYVGPDPGNRRHRREYHKRWPGLKVLMAKESRGAKDGYDRNSVSVHH
ncbi:hypothetical protein LY76DRAFT_152757 [Colletotrichum caudatum]|nr:hypothetical protein LY76DRAFT_152757 [Colletotrichum caudatum]